MEQQKGTSFNTETNKPSHGGFNTGAGESKSTEGDWASHNRESKADGSCDRTAEFYDQTKKTISDTYNKTAEALNKGYGQAMAYGRENPGTSVLIAFGGGLVAGLLLAVASRSRRRQNFYSSYAEPVVNSLSDIVSDIFRRR
jgi:ElaB/YqjD/DUF883 family membrane-anchored ribosome-binding protein